MCGKVYGAEVGCARKKESCWKMLTCSRGTVRGSIMYTYDRMVYLYLKVVSQFFGCLVFVSRV